MAKLIFAGAAAIDNIDILVELLHREGIDFSLIENRSMFDAIPAAHQKYVIESETFTYDGEVFIPLNEYWVSVARSCKVNNISAQAIQASRSKACLSSLLQEKNLPHVRRYFLDEPLESFPERYIARPDAGYSSYGIVSYKEMGPFDKDKIIEAVRASSSTSMAAVLSENQERIVVEDYLEGNEYSVDVFVDHGEVKILRLFYKSIRWVNGKPVCDCYVSVPVWEDFRLAISSWCEAIFTNQCISFAHFDFIATDTGMTPIDFSCRIGGSLDSIKAFSSIDSYIFHSMFRENKLFDDYVCQKHVMSHKTGRIKHTTYNLPEGFELFAHRKSGDLLHENIASARARVADVCFLAENLDDALAKSQNIDPMVVIDVHG